MDERCSAFAQRSLRSRKRRQTETPAGRPSPIWPSCEWNRPRASRPNRDRGRRLGQDENVRSICTADGEIHLVYTFFDKNKAVIVWPAGCPQGSPQARRPAMDGDQTMSHLLPADAEIKSMPVRVWPSSGRHSLAGCYLYETGARSQRLDRRLYNANFGSRPLVLLERQVSEARWITARSPSPGCRPYRGSLDAAFCGMKRHPPKWWRSATAIRFSPDSLHVQAWVKTRCDINTTQDVEKFGLFHADLSYGERAGGGWRHRFLCASTRALRTRIGHSTTLP